MKTWWLLLLALALVVLLSMNREYFANATTPDPFEYIDPMCPEGTVLDAKKRCAVPGVAPELGTCPEGYSQISGGKCKKNGSTEEIDPTCPSGKVFYDQGGEPGWGCLPPYATPFCPAGSTSVTTNLGTQCRRPMSGTGSSGGTGPSSNTMTNDMPRPSASNQQFRITLASYMGIPTNNDAEITKYANFVVKFYDDEYLPDKQVPTSDQINAWVDTQMDIPMEKKPGVKAVIDYWFTNGVPEPSSNGGTSSGDGAAAESESSSGSGGGSGSGSGGKNPKQNIWGPKWTSLGEFSGGPDADSTRTTKYPELMGGLGSKGEKKKEDSNLPSNWSLGITGGSRFLPFSRQPGDMDLIPDPYRTSRTYSPSSYSSKTDPVPFLNDFSAFFK